MEVSPLEAPEFLPHGTIYLCDIVVLLSFVEGGGRRCSRNEIVP